MRTPVDWHPLRLTTPVKQHVFGGRALADRLGRTGLPDGPVAETWEVSDVDGDASTVVDGPLAGRTLRQVMEEHPEELLGRHLPSGPRFPLLTKFIDGSRPLPVHLHADDATARRLEGEPHGKTEAWHVLDAAPGATALVGVRSGVGRDRLRQALLAQDFDAVMRRLPVRPGQTVYVPGGTLHSFGPDTLVYEIEQTSDIQQHAMPWHMEDGSPVDEEERHANIARLLDEWRPEPRPEFRPGLSIAVDDGVERTVLCAGPYFALERWTAGTAAPLVHTFSTALILSNAGAPVTVTSGGWSGRLDRARTLLLPAVLGDLRIQGPADVLIGYVPDLEHDVRAPLLAAGHGPAAIAALGEGLGPGNAPG
ncbi:type I phosphomannose isomerase catalytic subunit [Streptomyces sp. S.PNR 29]|uniref:type I phosphomannose isomerase catalytic subunit n=1 Tax=Streptomyces sp. S.PNR 29 TaxID=2973805 RepID=UPI0025B17AE8|nr:type I phosphomannose isomerase catalytic subunit [Streptomyces sp. S.PNR 29]MDN0199812.1 class I mannose-6-phosphate isomerase [Streptomyces sp. S.PNR 29]